MVIFHSYVSLPEGIQKHLFAPEVDAIVSSLGSDLTTLNLSASRREDMPQGRWGNVSTEILPDQVKYLEIPLMNGYRNTTMPYI